MRRSSRCVGLILLVGMVASFAFSSGALAALSTLYVDGPNPACSDLNSGDSSSPLCTISKAASIATAGQTVVVRSGTYNESVTIGHSGSAGSPIVFITAPSAAVTVSGGTRGFTVSSKSYITISGFNITQTTSNGIYLSGSDHISITGNHVSSAGIPAQSQTAVGIYVSSTTASLISGNTSDHNSDSGIYVTGSSTGDTISSNIAFNNAQQWQRNANGINIVAPGNTVIDNITHDNEDSGIQLYPGGNNNVVVDNVTYNNGDHGIDSLNVSGGTITGNTVYHNCTSGINVEGTSSSFVVENNIATDNAVYAAYNGISCNRGDGNIRVADSATSSTTADYNLVWLTTSGTMYYWGGSYSSLSAMRSAKGQEAHGLQADPRYVSSGNLALSAGSQAIDSADSGAPAEPSSDVLGNPRVDDPSTSNTGAGPRAFDDRGAYEFQGSGPPDSPPTASLVVTPTSGYAPLLVTADASGSTDADATPIASYKFDFGDGTVIGPGVATSAQHTYNAAATYTVKVTVTDTANLSSTAQKTVSVQADAAPAAVLTVTPPSGYAPLLVTADASGSTDADATPIASYKFDFGDGTVIGPGVATSAQHTYNAAATYTVKVTVTDTANLSSTAQKTVSVQGDAAPSAVLTVTPSSGYAPLSVTADASTSTDTDATPIATYTFDFGDGPVVGPQTGATAPHTYNAAGTYTVKVTVTDTAGLASTAQKTVTALGDSPPSAVLSVTPNSGTMPLAVSADASGSTDVDLSRISTYSFNFGDGTPATGPQASATASHTYTSAGSFTITVTVTDTAGLASTATATVAVADGKPAASLSVTPPSGSVGLTVLADATASTDPDSTPIASYVFDFGDGTGVVPSQNGTASHTYPNPGVYTVTVTVTDTAGFSSKATATVTVSSANLVGNPGFETNTSGWAALPASSGITLTQASGGHSGSSSALITNTTTKRQTCGLNDSPNWVPTTSAGFYTAQIWVKADQANAGTSFKLQLTEYSGSRSVGSVSKSVALTTSWQMVTVSYTIKTPGSTLDLNASTTQKAGTCFYADDVSLTFV